MNFFFSFVSIRKETSLTSLTVAAYTAFTPTEAFIPPTPDKRRTAIFNNIDLTNDQRQILDEVTAVSEITRRGTKAHIYERQGHRDT